jgi:transcriptional regulator with XRE-family HTH domain
MTFAGKLRELKDSSGLSEWKLAEAAGIPFGTLHDYVIARRLPSAAALMKLARALGVSCEVFAECEDLAPPISKPPKKKASSRNSSAPTRPRRR